MENKNKLFKFLFTGPVVVYSILLIFLPLIYIFVISFFKSDGYGGMVETITLGNYIQLFDMVYVKIFIQSIIIALVVTFNVNWLPIPSPNQIPSERSTFGLYHCSKAICLIASIVSIIIILIFPLVLHTLINSTKLAFSVALNLLNILLILYN